MPKPEVNEEITDPIVLAAMIEDPNEDEDVKQLRKEILEGEEPAAKSTSTDDEDEDEDDDKDEDDQDEDDKKSKPEKKPVEAEDDTDEDLDEDLEDEEDDEDEKPKTRKQKRKERQDDYEQSILKDNAKQRRQVPIPSYDPLNYEDESKEFKPSELKEDRERVAAIQFAKGAEAVRYWADQDRFWSDLTNEAKITSYDPTLSFLSETTPDGKKNEAFDGDKAADINAAYLEKVVLSEFTVLMSKGNRCITVIPANLSLLLL